MGEADRKEWIARLNGWLFGGGEKDAYHDPKVAIMNRILERTDVSQEQAYRNDWAYAVPTMIGSVIPHIWARGSSAEINISNNGGALVETNLILFIVSSYNTVMCGNCLLITALIATASVGDVYNPGCINTENGEAGVCGETLIKPRKILLGS